MSKFTWLSAGALVLTGLTTFFACSLQNPQVVVGAAARPVGESSGGSPSFDAVDHATWDRLLHRYVNEDGMVDYAAWKGNRDDRAALEGYLAKLSSANPEAPSSKEGKLAFWINAYNALTIHGILAVYPTSSIRNHTAKLFGYNIWDDLLLPVGGEKYSLNDMEHKILRKLGEPRIHFAIVCASIGCPRLRNEAYVPEKLEQQLADNTRDFFSRRKNLQVDRASHVVRVSAILDWFGSDFGPTPQAALASLSDYMPADAKQLISSADYSVAFLDYDWNLNKQ
ncbi:DUF547 domain-containing protein [Thermopirellula anaerolimosa]